MVKKIFRKVRTILFSPESDKKNKIRKYKSSGNIPWSEGYNEYKGEQIKNAINDPAILESFVKRSIPVEFGIGIDERIVEYPWIFSRLSDKECLLLDAGSTFNFGYILEQEKLKKKKIHICTFYPESPNFNEKGISYTYSDLRELPYKDQLFDEIVCQSTIEHIDMDNSIYGYSPGTDKRTQGKSYSYLNAVNELLRILKPGGMLLLTFPFGKFENHVFFQQFDNEMLSKVEDEISGKGEYAFSFIKYLKAGWVFAKREECHEIESYNPHTGKGKKDDGAAHCRCVCLIRFIKAS